MPQPAPGHLSVEGKRSMGMSISWITDAVAGQSPVVPPDSPALALGDADAVNWGELREADLRYASALVRAGVRKGDRVGILMKNSVEYVFAMLAIARAGGIAVRLNWRLTPHELKFILNDSGTSLLFVDDDLLDSIAGLRAETGVREYVVRRSANEDHTAWAIPLEQFIADAVRDDFPSMSLDDAQSLMYTSGTTGLPKGALWSHGNTLWFGAIQSMKWKFDEHTVGMTAGPLFHAGGWEAVLLPALVSHGMAVTYPSGQFDLGKYMAAARKHAATMMLFYSFMGPELLRMPDYKTVLPPSAKQMILGGDAALPWVIDRFNLDFPGVDVIQVFGLTEGGAISTCLDGKNADRAGSVGKPMPFTEVRVVLPGGQPAGPGEVGEVLVRSPAVSPGYWNRPDATASTFVDGWCHTGDLGSIDADGFLTLRGRDKDMIRSGGENVYPAEVEVILTKAPGVADVAVVGVPDERWIEVGCAVLVAEDGIEIDIEAVRRHCVERLAKYKVPRHYVVVSQIPRTPSGKIKKYLLREEYSGIGASEPAAIKP